MELIPIEEALRAIVALFFAYVAAVGVASAVKFIALDQEIRLKTKEQTLFIEALGDLFTAKFEEKIHRREKRLEERLASFGKAAEKT